MLIFQGYNPNIPDLQVITYNYPLILTIDPNNGSKRDIPNFRIPTGMIFPTQSSQRLTGEFPGYSLGIPKVPEWQTPGSFRSTIRFQQLFRLAWIVSPKICFQNEVCRYMQIWDHDPLVYAVCIYIYIFFLFLNLHLYFYTNGS